MLTKLTEWLRAEQQSLRVVGTFLFLIVAFFFLLSWEPIVKRVDIGSALAHLVAWASYALLKIIGFVVGLDVSLSHVRLSTLVAGADPFEVDVTAACSGAVPTSIYLAAVLAYPAGRRAKLIGSAMGIGAIYLINILRVCVLFFVGLYSHQLFHETHVYVAQALVIAAAVALWLYWAGRFAHAPGR
jgi:exosortase/archaeosortase family protein